jgi:hypothetical protein
MGNSRLKYFYSDAAHLMGLIKIIYGQRWHDSPRVKNISLTLGGRVRVYVDGRIPESEILETKTESAEQIFLRLVDDIYNGVPCETALCGIGLYKWTPIARIIIFGKESGIPREDWFFAARGGR